jgi:hypothetical protein
MADVARWVGVQDVDDVAQALMEIGNQQALDAWAARTSAPTTPWARSTAPPRPSSTCSATR